MEVTREATPRARGYGGKRHRVCTSSFVQLNCVLLRWGRFSNRHAPALSTNLMPTGGTKLSSKASQSGGKI
jgi:hypothetical protein